MPEATDTVEFTRRIEAPIETVFALLTHRDGWLRWMGVAGEVDPTVGGRYRVEVLGDDHVAAGTFLAIEPYTRVVFTWGWEGGDGVPPGSSVVEIQLRPDGGGTALRLLHHDLPAVAHEPHAMGWNHYLDRLVVRAQGGDPGPDPWLTHPPG